MARQEIASTFGDGLMMDLNPINTPKSVLTDCLNGTYITYNGNEFVLQNDMGNYKLKNCKLPTNFIPVGVKGYGDILYIVSYNPITKETEIGSYPAPQSIFTTGDSEALLASEDDLAPFVIKENEDGKTEIEYPEIIKTNKKPIFIFNGPDEETYKLNPGDEFRFSGELTSPAFIYQHLNFYIIDEDNKLYDIDDTQIYHEDGTLVSLDLRKVFWETPGWLAAQYDLYVPDKFNLNLKSLNVPEFLTAQSNDETSQAEGKPLDELEPDKGYFKVSMDLSSQTIITDKLFQTELDKHFGNELANTYDHLYIRYLIKRNENTPDVGEDDYGTFKGIVVSLDDKTTKDYTNGVITKDEDYVYYDIPVWKHNYQDDIITAYNNVRPIWFCKNPDKKDGSEDLDIANYHGVVELTAYPIIKYNGKILEFTQFSTTQRFPLNTLKNSSDITIADSIYKWSIDDDSCTISFNINGPFINARNITGKYEIYRINFNDPNNPTILDTPDCSDDISNLVLYGQNTINVKWGNEFQKEDGIYIFRIILNQNDSILSKKSFILIPSIVFNEWFGTFDNYLDSITATTWLQKFINSLNISSILINYIDIDFSNDSPDSDFIQYKWSDSSEDYKSLDYSNITSELNKLYNEKYYNLKNTNTTPNWESDVQNQARLLLRIDCAKLNPEITYNINIQFSNSFGKLWCPTINTTLSLKQGSISQNLSILQTAEWNFNTNNLDKTYKLDLSKNTLDISISPNWQKHDFPKPLGNPEFPFLKSRLKVPKIRLYAGNTEGWTGPNYHNRNRSRIAAQTYRYSTTETNVPNGGGIGLNSRPKNKNIHYNKENSFFGDISRGLDLLGSSFAYGWLYVTGKNTGATNNYIKTFGAVDSNVDESLGTELHEADYTTEDWNGIIFKGLNGNTGQPPAVYIDFKNISEDIKKSFLNALCYLCIKSYDSTSSFTYFPTLTLNQDWILEKDITINKCDILLEIKNLQVDNLKYLENGFQNIYEWINNNNIYIGSLLNGDINSINLKKETYNYTINPTITISLNYNKSTTYSDSINDISQYITTNNNDYTIFISSGNSRKAGINLVVGTLNDLETYLADNKISDDQSQDPIDRSFIIELKKGPDITMTDTLLNKFKITFGGASFNITNLWYNNKTNLTIQAQNKDDGKFVHQSATVDYCYYEQWQG